MTTSGQITCHRCGKPIGVWPDRCRCLVLYGRLHGSGRFAGPIEISEKLGADAEATTHASKAHGNMAARTGSLIPPTETISPDWIDNPWLWRIGFGIGLLVFLAAVVLFVIVYAP